MKKIILSLVILVALAGAAFAAVQINSSGTRVGTTDKLDLYGPTVTESGGVTTINMRYIDSDLYLADGVNIDGSIYLTGDGGMYRPLILRQPDGGCSSCGVDVAGTTWACGDITCPAGMTQ